MNKIDQTTNFSSSDEIPRTDENLVHLEALVQKLKTYSGEQLAQALLPKDVFQWFAPDSDEAEEIEEITDLSLEEIEILRNFSLIARDLYTIKKCFITNIIVKLNATAPTPELLDSLLSLDPSLFDLVEVSGEDQTLIAVNLRIYANEAISDALPKGASMPRGGGVQAKYKSNLADIGSVYTGRLVDENTAKTSMEN